MWRQLDDTLNRNQVEGMLGFLPQIISPSDPRPIRDQINTNYSHGGGYFPYGEGQWKFNAVGKTLKYPGDPTLKPIAELPVRDELFIVFPHAICCILQPDGSFDVIRMD